MNGGENWLLAKPQLRIEASPTPCACTAASGLLGAKMVGADRVDGPIAPYGGNGAGLPSGVQEGMIWNTFGGGAAVSLSARTSVFLESSVLMNGLEVAGPEWFRIPFSVTLGVSTVL
jgi:hypothetical protein